MKKRIPFLLLVSTILIAGFGFIPQAQAFVDLSLKPGRAEAWFFLDHFLKNGVSLDVERAPLGPRAILKPFPLDGCQGVPKRTPPSEVVIRRLASPGLRFG